MTSGSVGPVRNAAERTEVLQGVFRGFGTGCVTSVFCALPPESASRLTYVLVVFSMAQKIQHTEKSYIFKMFEVTVKVILDTDSSLCAMLQASLTSSKEQGLGKWPWDEIPVLPPTAVWLCKICKNPHSPSL